MVDVDPRNPDRLFVAALGHPYGPNAERGIFRSTDGGKSFEKVLYKDEYTSGNDVRIDPTNPDIVYAAIWQQQQSYVEGGGFGGASGGIFKSTDGGTTWKQMTQGLPTVTQANLAIAPSDPKTLYAMSACEGSCSGEGGGGGRGGGGGTGLFKSTDGGEHWFLAAHPPGGDATAYARYATARPYRRRRPAHRDGRPEEPERRLQLFGGVLAHRGRRPHLVGRPRRARRRRLPAALDQPEQHRHPPARGRSGRGDLGQPRRELEQLVYPADGGDVPRLDRHRVSVSGVRRTAGFRIRLRAEPLERRRDHVPRLASGQYPGVRRGGARPEESGSRLRQLAHQRLALQPAYGPDEERRTRHVLTAGGTGRCRGLDVRTRGAADRTSRGPELQSKRAHDAARVVAAQQQPPLLHLERRLEDARRRAHLDADQRRSRAADVGRPGERRQIRERRDARTDRHDHRALALAERRQRALGRNRRRQHPDDVWMAARNGPTSPRRRSSPGRASSTSRPGTTTRRPPTPPRTRCASTTSTRTSGARTTAARRGRRSTTASRRARPPTRSARIRGRRACSMPPPTRRCGSRSTMATTGSRCGWTCPRSRCATSNSRTTRRACAPTSSPARMAVASGSWTT